MTSESGREHDDPDTGQPGWTVTLHPVWVGRLLALMRLIRERRIRGSGAWPLDTLIPDSSTLVSTTTSTATARPIVAASA